MFFKENKNLFFFNFFSLVKNEKKFIFLFFKNINNFHKFLDFFKYFWLIFIYFNFFLIFEQNFFQNIILTQIIPILIHLLAIFKYWFLK
jgi:hypothetical protein